MKEIWKAVVGHEGQYEVSNLGRVRSLDRTVTRLRFGKRIRVHRKGRLMSSSPDTDGYLKVVLSGKPRKTQKVHRLVAQAFVGPCPVGKQVMHLDGIKTNNRPANLRYGTSQENNSHKKAHGTSLIGERNHKHKLTAAQVKEIRRLRGTVRQKDLAARYGVAQSQISHTQIRRTWAHV